MLASSAASRALRTHTHTASRHGPSERLYHTVLTRRTRAEKTAVTSRSPKPEGVKPGARRCEARSAKPEDRNKPKKKFKRKMSDPSTPDWLPQPVKPLVRPSVTYSDAYKPGMYGGKPIQELQPQTRKKHSDNSEGETSDEEVIQHESVAAFLESVDAGECADKFKEERINDMRIVSLLEKEYLLHMKIKIGSVVRIMEAVKRMKNPKTATIKKGVAKPTTYDATELPGSIHGKKKAQCSICIIGEKCCLLGDDENTTFSYKPQASKASKTDKNFSSAKKRHGQTSSFHQLYNKHKAQIDGVYAILKEGVEDEDYAKSVLREVKGNSLFKKLKKKMLHITAEL